MNPNALEAALLADPTRDDLRLELGSHLLRLNRYEEALACFDQCRPNAEKPALFGKAAALQLLGRFDEAESAYERLLALDPAAREALSNLIAMHVERFNLSRVEHYSLRLRELDPQAPAARKGLALVAIERREYQAAAQYCSEISGDDSGADASTDGSIEYRLSWKVTGKLREAAEAPRSEV